MQRKRNLHEGCDQLEHDQDDDRRFKPRRPVGVDDVGQRMRGFDDHVELALEDACAFVELVFVDQAGVEALEIGPVP